MRPTFALPVLRYRCRVFGERAVVEERRWEKLASERCGWHTTRHVFVFADFAMRGTKRTYPYAPADALETVISTAMFEECWREAEVK